MALRGIDLVLEFTYSLCLSQRFLVCYRAIKTLESTGIVSHLAFGAETNNLSILAEIG